MKKFSWLPMLLLAISIFNYPNPFDPQAGEVTTFECTPTSTSEAYLYIYDLGARLIAQKDWNLQGGAKNSLSWNGYADSNERVSSGVYLYRLIDKASKASLAKGKAWIINK
ncbi:MAG: hypothetical protein ABIH50_03965 [bacterium]